MEDNTTEQTGKEITVKTLLELLSLHGGEIVCTASLKPDQIEQARASGRMYVDENGIGYVWEPNIMMIPTTDEEVEFFEKWYPLDVEMPEHLKDPSFILDLLEKKEKAERDLKTIVREAKRAGRLDML